MLYHQKFILALVIFGLSVPLTGFSLGDPKEDPKPKKVNSEVKPSKKTNTEDSIDIYKSENKVYDNLEIPKNDRSTQSSPAKTSDSIRQNLNENVEAEDEDPNSAMSFNIIYYIIDKFKFTDPLQ